MRRALGTMVGATLSLVACGERGEGGSAAPVVGAEAHIDTTHDAVVAVATGNGALCTGSVIGRSANGTACVLTAAHCCRSGDPPKRVIVGSDYTDPAARFDVAGFHRHPCYNPLSNDYDVCVVKVEDAGAMNARAIPVASMPDALAPGDTVTVVGYGSTPATNTIRRSATARLIEISDLTLAVDQREGQGGICFGDSGGPMLASTPNGEVLAGVVSFGAPTSLCNVIGVGARVSFPGVHRFIERVLADQPPTLKQLLVRRTGLALGPVNDTYIASDRPDENFGQDVELRVGAPPGPPGIRRALLRFDLAVLPAGATLMTARVGLHQESRTGPATISVHRVIDDWDPRQVTWSTFGEGGFDPAPETAFSNATAVVGATEEVWFDITALARQWATGAAPNHGVLLDADRAETQLIASEIGRGAERPWMSVCYQPE